ncbi:MAG: hypothetical protein CEN89_716 [Candidatus Berkelbacteria bacterium Licking1014_7]|uniref:DUF3098 domain-containing protein n=1 Tax=Candidatus Berkelbacteria bacterium Licking1014_7 TaxID=2017147 RepID=A0A554LHS7_9BACT|nr:MAG: hypothetical protein CEN89_716 [Candidatus Berkelbacteria bacterium Licking1014_7]
MKTIKIREKSQFGDLGRQARKIGWYMLAFGGIFFLIGASIFYSSLRTFGALGLLPSLIGAIIAIPGIGIFVWGLRIIKTIK